MNEDLKKKITAAMRDAALTVIQTHRNTCSTNPLSVVAGDVADVCARACADAIDANTAGIEREYVAEYTEIGEILDMVGIDQHDEEGIDYALHERVKILAMRNRSAHVVSTIAELANLAHRGWKNLNPLYVRRVNEIRKEWGLPEVES